MYRRQIQSPHRGVDLVYPSSVASISYLLAHRLMSLQVERALRAWSTGNLVISSTNKRDHFSKENWADTSKTVAGRDLKDRRATKYVPTFLEFTREQWAAIEDRASQCRRNVLGRVGAHPWMRAGWMSSPPMRMIMLSSKLMHVMFLSSFKISRVLISS
jgi:hypothetical protein